jgi:MoxR-vWA-beta-propeller ternary system domain bpX2
MPEAIPLRKPSWYEAMMRSFEEVGCASLPPDALALLAPLRCEPGVQVAQDAGRLWVRFDAGNERVLHRVLPLPGVELYAFRDGAWRRFGQSMPAFDFPHDPQFDPLYQVLFPAPVLPVPPGDGLLTPARLVLKPDHRPRPTTALTCPLLTLLAWVDTVPSARLERMHGVLRDGQMLVIGPDLPVLPAGERFWGKLVLTPLGYSPAPALPETDLRAAAGVAADELLLLRHDRAEALPRTALSPISRASLRLAASEGVS